MSALVRACALLLATLPLLAAAASNDVIDVETAARRYYDAMEALDYERMRALSTEEFEILDRGYRYGLHPFKMQLEVSKKLGIKMSFVLQDFRTIVSGDTAWTSFVTLRPGYKYDGLDALIMRRFDGRWLVDRFVHMRMVNGTDPHRVPGGQKPVEADATPRPAQEKKP